ncbi:cupin domain-containing protein [Burkholderia sp. 3C]
MAPPLANDGHGIHATRHDFEGAHDWMAHICGPHGLQVSRPNRVQFNHSGTVLRSMASTLGYVEYGTDVTISVEDGAPLNCYSISLPLTGRQELAARGRTWLSDADRGVILSPHETQALSIDGNCRKIIMSVPRAALRQVLEGLLQRPFDDAITFEPEMSAAAGEPGAWWRMVRFLADEMERSGGVLNHLQMAGDLEQALLKGLLIAQPHNYSTELADVLRPTVPRYVHLARQFIQAHAREDVTLEDIERAAGVSRQKLFASFRQHVGQGPMACLKRYRLEGVRRDLVSDGSARNVSTVALAWGFTHLGRFSAEYKSLFGETPSQTLKRRG